MAEDAEIRRENFRRLWGAEFSPVTASIRLWGSPSFWSDLFHGRKSFGEKLARRIEEQLGLPRLALDQPRGVTPHEAADAGTRIVGLATPEKEAFQKGVAAGALKAPTLTAALDAVLTEFAALSPGQWRMLRVRLDDLPGHPEMLDDVRDDVLRILPERSGKRQAAA